MTLPDGFQFSQNSLQDFVDCERRFQLRYIMRQAWPAVSSEPADELEKLVDLGRRFHRLAEQHSLGVPDSVLGRSIESDVLRKWWRNYLEIPPPSLPSGRRYPELTLSTPIHAFRLVAKYDLLEVDAAGNVLVIDWKTSRRRPDSVALAERLQTRIYCFVAVEAAASLNSVARIPPSKLAMVYWFSEFPAEAEILPYSDTQHQRNEIELSRLVSRIAAQAKQLPGSWPLTEELGRCRFCNYRSLCNRGIVPGPVAEWDTDAALDLELEFDFEDVEEIEY